MDDLRQEAKRVMDYDRISQEDFNPSILPQGLRKQLVACAAVVESTRWDEASCFALIDVMYILDRLEVTKESIRTMNDNKKFYDYVPAMWAALTGQYRKIPGDIYDTKRSKVKQSSNSYWRKAQSIKSNAMAWRAAQTVCGVFTSMCRCCTVPYAILVSQQGEVEVDATRSGEATGDGDSGDETDDSELAVIRHARRGVSRDSGGEPSSTSLVVVDEDRVSAHYFKRFTSSKTSTGLPNPEERVRRSTTPQSGTSESEHEGFERNELPSMARRKPRRNDMSDVVALIKSQHEEMSTIMAAHSRQIGEIIDLTREANESMLRVVSSMERFTEAHERSSDERNHILSALVNKL